MADFPKFFIADNPMADPGIEYVYHSQKPRFLARYTPDDPLSHFAIVDDIDNMAAFFNGDVTKVAGLMRRLGDWFVAYCKWEEEHANDNEE